MSLRLRRSITLLQEIFHRSRRTGYTTAICRAAIAQNGYVITKDERQGHMLNREFGCRINTVGLDQLDHLVHHIRASAYERPPEYINAPRPPIFIDNAALAEILSDLDSALDSMQPDDTRSLRQLLHQKEETIAQLKRERDTAVKQLSDEIDRLKAVISLVAS